MEAVLARLREARLTVKSSKITLAGRQISFLGHLVSTDWARIDQERTSNLRKFPVPTNKKAIARFIGMANIFRKFVPNFAQLSGPLNALRKTGVTFRWDESHQASFEAIKAVLSNPPDRAIPNFHVPFVVQTDASNSGVTAVLLQEQNGERRPIVYASRKLSPTELKYSVYECDGLAVLLALEKFKFYLEPREILLETDNQALSWVLGRPWQTGRIARWAVRISAFRFKVKRSRGSDNSVPNALSGMFQQEELSEVEGQNLVQEGIAGMLTEVPELFSDLSRRQEQDPRFASIKQKLLQDTVRVVPSFAIVLIAKVIPGFVCLKTSWLPYFIIFITPWSEGISGFTKP